MPKIDQLKVLDVGVFYFQSPLVHDETCPDGEVRFRLIFVRVLNNWQLVFILPQIYHFRELAGLNPKLLIFNIDKRQFDHVDTFLCVDREPAL